MTCLELRLVNSASEFPAMVAAIENFGVEHGCPLQVINDINIALDELVSNIIAYGYEIGQKGSISIRLALHQEELIVEADDDGRYFDLTQAPAPDLQSSVRERQVGGVGIHFIKSLMDEVTYTRLDGLNRVRLTRRLSTAGRRAQSRREDGAA